MGYKTLNEVRDLLRSNLPAFICIGRPNRNPCDEVLENEDKKLALELLAATNANLTRKSQWNILALLLCTPCQKTYTQKNNIWAQWEAETPEIDPGGRRGRSPYSKCSKTPESDRRRSSGLTLAVASESPPFRGRSSGQNTPPSPTEDALSRRSARHEPSSSARPMRRSNSDIIMVDTETADADCTNGSALSEAHPCQPSRTTPPLRKSGGSSFSAGESSTWAPWKLRAEVLELLWEPLPDPNSKGSIYAVEVVGTPYVKIGITTRDVSERLKEIQKRHGQNLRIGSKDFKDNIPLLQLYRLERLVHADLAFFQRNLTVQRTTQRRTHREYFQIDLATAMETICLWLKIMQTIGLDAGTEIDPHIKSSVRDWIRDIDTPPVGASPGDYEPWKTVNTDHEQRHKMWSQAFKLEDGGHKKRRVDRTVSSLTVAAMALCFLYSSRLPQWVKDVSALFLLTAGALYAMDTTSSDGCITWVINTSKAISCFVAPVKRFTRLKI